MDSNLSEKRVVSMHNLCCAIGVKVCLLSYDLKGNVQPEPFHVSGQIMFQDKKTVP